MTPKKKLTQRKGKHPSKKPLIEDNPHPSLDRCSNSAYNNTTTESSSNRTETSCINVGSLDLLS